MINIIRLLNIVVDILFDSQNANLEILYKSTSLNKIIGTVNKTI